MLGKLMKYEFKATSRFMLLLYAVLFAVSVIISVGIRLNLDEIFARINQNFELGTLIFAVLAFMVVMMFFVMNVVVLCGMFFYSISRFRNNMLGDEGYLMHTLPVKVRDNILAKTLVSTIWTVISAFAVLFAYFILFLGIADTNTFNGLFRIFSQINIDVLVYVREAILVLFEFCILCIVAVVQTYLHIYASMAVGYSSNTHRAAKSIGIYILISIVVNIVETAALFILPVFGVLINNYIFSNIHFFMWYAIVLTVVSGVAFYFITEYFMKRKLNLQ